MKHQNKSAVSAANYIQASDNCKRVLESANLLMLVTQGNVSPPGNLALVTFSKIPNSISTKVNTVIPFLTLLGLFVARPVSNRGLMFPVIYNKESKSY